MSANEINETINNICGKFGTAASELVPQLAKYRIAVDSVGVFVCVVLIILFAVAMRAIWKKADELDSDEVSVFIGVPFMALVVSVVIGIGFLVAIVGWVAAPDMKAIEYICNLVG